MDDDREVQVASVLPQPLCPVFEFDKFNKMQSQCLEAWNSDANLLISAPTGSGKTVCLELAILRLVNKAVKSMDDVYIRSGGLGGKVVFIAPTKALCQEKEDHWRQKFAFLGLNIEAITGDIAPKFSETRVNEADLILTTAEKWDSITRNCDAFVSIDLVTQVSLLLLDEVHQIGESRGACLESVVTRMLVSSDQAKQMQSIVPASNLRVIAISATVGNVNELGQWLRVDSHNVRQFDASYRPVDLEFRVFGYNIRNQWQSAKVYEEHLLDVIGKLSDKKPTLVFCPSRRSTFALARSVVEKLGGRGKHIITQGNLLTKHLGENRRQLLQDSSSKCRDEILASMLPCGVAVHNAEMNLQSRRLVEQLFRESLVQCLFSTSTLAQGVNLPARLVIIAGTSVYHDGKLHEYERNMLLQMCGRAGRPGLDTKGIAAIMTSKTNLRRYKNIARAPPTVIESQLGGSLEECYNAEVARQFITDIPTAITFMTKTFFWVRASVKAPVNETSPGDQNDYNSSKLAVTTVNRLANSQLICVDDDYYGLSSTLAGLSMAKFCVSFQTMKHLMNELPQALSPFQVMTVIASTDDVVQDVLIRRSEKKRLNELKSNLRLPVRGRLRQPFEKVLILLQMIMAEGPNAWTAEYALRSEGSRLLQKASRVCNCLLSLVLDKGIRLPFGSLLSVLQVCRAIQNGTFWDGPTPLRQIQSVSSSYVKLLSRKGISSIPALAATERSRIDGIIGAKVPVGEKILTELRNFPRFDLTTQVIRAQHNDTSMLQINVQLEVFGQLANSPYKQRARNRGFVMVGSHAVGLIDIRTFSLNKYKHELKFMLSQENMDKQGKWIDVRVGSENTVGIDERVVIQLGSESGVIPLPQIAEKDSQSEKLTCTKPSVTASRVSKKFVQTTVTQALTRGFIAKNSPVRSEEMTNLKNIKLLEQRLSSNHDQPKKRTPLQTSCFSKDDLHQQHMIKKKLNHISAEELPPSMNHNQVCNSKHGVKKRQKIRHDVENTQISSLSKSTLNTNPWEKLPRTQGQSVSKEYDHVFRGLFDE